MVQNSYDLGGSRGLSDFDARHRFVVSAIYELPFQRQSMGRGLAAGRDCAVPKRQPGQYRHHQQHGERRGGHTQARRQLVRSISSAALTPGLTLRYLRRSRALATWAETWSSVRRSITPIFRSPRPRSFGERLRLELRAEVFDLFNHANFGQPGNVVGTPSFGQITNTRFPTGESGSSRQIQFATRLIF